MLIPREDVGTFCFKSGWRSLTDLALHRNTLRTGPMSVVGHERRFRDPVARLAVKADIADRQLRAMCGLTHRNKRNGLKLTGLAHHPGCPSGKSFVLDCANDRREYGAASAPGDRL